jgi:hypothetical protein
MNRRIWILIALLLLAAPTAPSAAQTDALNLPTDLYVLLNDGVIQRYGIGAAGVVNITSPDVFVLDFGVSSDGTLLAYRTQEALNLAALGDIPAPPTAVDTTPGVPPLRGRGETVAWSPTGDAVAYTTMTGFRTYFVGGAFADIQQTSLLGLYWSPGGHFIAAEAEDDIWWIYRREGNAIILTAALPSSMGTAWASETELAFAPLEGGLTIMALSAGNPQTPLLPNSAEYRLPHLAPEGNLLVFRRNKDEARVPTGYGQLISVARTTIEPEVIGSAAIDLTGSVRWAPGEGLMIAFQGGVLALFDPNTGQAFPLPIANAVAYSWGPYPPPDRPAAEGTPEAIFPEQFPTLDPATQLPGLTMVTPEATADVPKTTAEAGA